MLFTEKPTVSERSCRRARLCRRSDTGALPGVRGSCYLVWRPFGLRRHLHRLRRRLCALAAHGTARSNVSMLDQARILKLPARFVCHPTGGVEGPSRTGSIASFASSVSTSIPRAIVEARFHAAGVRVAVYAPYSKQEVVTNQQLTTPSIVTPHAIVEPTLTEIKMSDGGISPV